MKRLTITALTVFWAACADVPGSGWGELSGIATVELEEVESRKQPDGAIRTENGFDVYVDELSLEVEELVFYAGESADALEPVVRVPIEDEAPLLDGRTFIISEETCDAGCVVGERTVIREVSVRVHELHGTGTVIDRRGGRLPDGGVKWQLDVPFETAVLSQPVEARIDEHSDAIIATEVELHVSPSIFDEVEWQAFAASPTADATEHLLEALLRSELNVELETGSDESADDHEEEPEEDEGDGHGH